VWQRTKCDNPGDFSSIFLRQVCVPCFLIIPSFLPDVLGKEGSPFAIEVDLMAPLDAGRSPKVHKPALNHVGLWVDDLQAAVNWLSKDKEVRFAPGGIRKGASGHDVAFIHPIGNDTHPKSGCGVLIELVQAPESIIRALDL